MNFLEFYKKQTFGFKVIVEHKLTISKRLTLSEQAWYSLASHFSIYLMDKDAIDLTDVQKFANTWRELIEIFDREQEQREFETSKSLNRLVYSIQTLRNTFRQNHLYNFNEILLFFTFYIIF